MARLFPLVLLLLAVLVAAAAAGKTPTSVGIDAAVPDKMCETLSTKDTRECFRDVFCKASCQAEGFEGGYCLALRRRCMCTNPCNSS